MLTKFETRPCAECGKPLTRLPSQFNRSKNCYCGPVCKGRHAPKARAVNLKETRSCPNCGKPVTKYLSQIRSGAGWACSRHCGATLNGKKRAAEGTWIPLRRPRTGKDVSCEVCGKQFYQGPNAFRQFCSIACHNVGQTKEKIIKQCERCGKEMQLKPSQSARRFCSYGCSVMSRTKGATGAFHNERPIIRNLQGYLTVYEPTHPNASQHSGRVLQHRLVMEQAIGRTLRTDEQVHHRNSIKSDNRLENLEIVDPSTHTRVTNQNKMERQTRERQQLAEYERRFGPLQD